MKLTREDVRSMEETIVRPKFDLSNTKIDHFWVSFSFRGVCQGACSVRAKTLEDAINRINEAIAIPSFDDVVILPIPYCVGREGVLMTKEELMRDSKTFGVYHGI